MSDGAVRLSVEGSTACVQFDRVLARNAMTWPMYEQLGDICTQLLKRTDVRVVIFRGAGGEAFVAGTDIGQFQSFSGGADGVAYERRVENCIEQIERLPMPTLALVEGWAVGGGLVIAAACDFRIATPGSRFGVPVARTLGNCLSINNLARLVGVFGIARVKRMLLLAELIGAEEALGSGFVLQVCASAEITAAAFKLAGRLSALAPLTQSVTKEALRRLVTHGLPDDEDLIRRCYASLDFHEGVAAFVAKRAPIWRGEEDST